MYHNLDKQIQTCTNEDIMGVWIQALVDQCFIQAVIEKIKKKEYSQELAMDI